MQLMTVRDMWGERYAQCIRIRRHVLYADEPAVAGGRDTGPGPYDFLLAGLGACTAMTLKMYAIRHGLNLVHTTVELYHEIQRGNDSTLDHFHRVIHLDGDLTDDQRTELLRAAEHCPVSQTLRTSSLVQTNLAGTNTFNPGNVPGVSKPLVEGDK
jgi:putative redox protein